MPGPKTPKRKRGNGVARRQKRIVSEWTPGTGSNNIPIPVEMPRWLRFAERLYDEFNSDLNPNIPITGPYGTTVSYRRPAQIEAPPARQAIASPKTPTPMEDVNSATAVVEHLPQKRNNMKNGTGMAKRRTKRTRRLSKRSKARRSTRKTKRTRRSGVRAKTPKAHALLGVDLQLQSSGIVSGETRRALYIGHSTTPEIYIFLLAMMSMIKQTNKKLGFDIRNLQEYAGNGGFYELTFYVNQASTATTSISYTVVNATTPFYNVASSLQNDLQSALATNNGLQPYEFNFTLGGNTAKIELDKATITFDCLSKLKLQNRTNNDDATDSTVVNDLNNLVGKKYSGFGTGCYYDDKRTVKSAGQFQSFICDETTGLIKRTDVATLSTGAANSLQNPPISKNNFTTVTRLVTMPTMVSGLFVTSNLRSHTHVKFTKFIDMWTKHYNVGTFDLSSMGKFAFFGLTKFIDSSGSVPSVAYELELDLGCTVSGVAKPVTMPYYVPM